MFKHGADFSYAAPLAFPLKYLVPSCSFNMYMYNHFLHIGHSRKNRYDCVQVNQ